MLKELIKLSNHLDAKGLKKEADYLDGVIKKLSKEYAVNPEEPYRSDKDKAYISENRDKALQTLERARGVVVEAYNFFVNELYFTDRIYVESKKHMMDALNSIDFAKSSLTGRGDSL